MAVEQHFRPLSYVKRLAARQEVTFFSVLPKADVALASAWWVVLILRGLLPAGFAIAMGSLVGAVQHRSHLAIPLTVVGVMFVLLQVLAPVHVAIGQNLGDRTAAWLYDRLTRSCVLPPGIAHLEDPALANDLSMARDFDLGITAPPISVSMDFIAASLVELIGGLALTLVLAAYAWWAPMLLGAAWLSTHILLRESAVWRDRNTKEVRDAQRESEYTFRLAVDPPASKEVRLFGLAEWVVDEFRERRERLFRLQYSATRLRERPLFWSLLLVAVANGIVFWSLASSGLNGSLNLSQIVVYAQAAVGSSMIAFGGLNWALDGSAAPVAATLRLEPAMSRIGRLRMAAVRTETAIPARDIVFRDVTFRYPGSSKAVLEAFNLRIPAGSSMAIVGQNGAGKTTLAKLLCRLYDPDSGAIEIDGTDLRELDLEFWRSRLAAVFQDFIRFELTLRENVSPSGAPDLDVLASLAEAGMPVGDHSTRLTSLDTILSRAYSGGTDLSGGQWQRIALARAICGVRTGAGLVLLDEPTAQLDIRGEAEIFGRLLEATRNCTTLLISHRFSTVRHADRICVVEGGQVAELGSHGELMARGERYRTMFDLQAQRFARGDAEEEEEEALDTLS